MNTPAKRASCTRIQTPFRHRAAIFWIETVRHWYPIRPCISCVLPMLSGKKKDKMTAFCQLVNLIDAEDDAELNDTLPISNGRRGSFAFTKDEDSSDYKSLQTFCTKQEWGEDLDADAVVDNLRTLYEVDSSLERCGRPQDCRHSLSDGTGTVLHVQSVYTGNRHFDGSCCAASANSRRNMPA